MSVGLSDADPKSRPVTVAKLTTVVGMIPLLVDAPFVAMAVTIFGGLVAATVLTMVTVRNDLLEIALA